MINHLPPQKNRQIPFASPDDNQSEQSLHLSEEEGGVKGQEVGSQAPPKASWQVALTEVITDINQLLAMLDISHIKSQLYVPDNFSLRVPKGFVAKMQPGNANDPLLLQVLPSKREQIAVSGYVADPLAENEQNPIKGLLHKYHSRVLVTVTGACAIHCRYCFRQHFDYQANLPKSEQLTRIQQYIAEHPEINEVILSGGDPLTLSNRRLFLWLDALESLPQLQTIRIHTRLPIVIPERLDSELVQRLQSSRCRIVMVLHSNHANEIDDHTAAYLRQARDSGITLLNQAVLLAGINDTLQAQLALSERLFEAGVLPYYLHVLDKVAGAAHFDLPKAQAVELYWQMLAKLPGYLVPKLVQELPNKPFKTPVDLYANNRQSL
ncbi:EF-P beta-lysylation protein EpmB [Psychrobacter sp. FDAARGOS_221]|uniref:EF-P beta-lysylation protein EpmB n=1 Tax=Psychrobacter sp. FDAARGOS_221 TaxID=1975705 RepID=UPI000BB59AB9|nr:EF-P beta-lysylation protein EpmB [Psychrobacter sp. FDAARGOS_221]PNK60274.1 EF-P beta-lysylation protein EpmB [Psychrobacter sp. FDAARGOS_221]